MKIRALLAAVLLLAAACGDIPVDHDAAPGAPDGPPGLDASTAPDAFACMGIGKPCTVNGECPDQLQCYFAPEGVCSLPMLECGGFANTPCPEGRTCALHSPAGLGVCVISQELECICADAPDTVQGC